MRPQIRKRILNKYNNKCCYCGFDTNLEIDHIIPISKGGREDENNMQVLCRSCNSSKGNRINILDWIKYDLIEDCILISRDMPINAFKSNEISAAITLLFKYK